jgi:glycosyltransferase involved in cell wall biosynthesis
MHILFLPSWYPASPNDPVGCFFREQALALLHSGCKVGVLAPANLSLRQPLAAGRASRSMRIEDDHGVITYRSAMINWTPRMWGLNASRFARAGWQLYKAYVANHGHPDLVHVHSALLGGSAAVKIKDRAGIPFVLSEHSTAYARGLVSPSGLLLAKSIAEKASDRFAVSTPFARQLESKLYMSAQSWSVMPNSVDQRFLNSPLPVTSVGRFRFLHVSQLDDKKRVELIIRAFAETFARAEDVELLVGGDGPTRLALEALVAHLGLTEQVKFLGRLDRDEVCHELTKANAFVLSSEHETFGVVLVEAMAMGLPVIATRCGGPEDIVDSEIGLLVPIEDATAIGDAMREVLVNASSYSRQHLRSLCRARYGPDVITERWQKQYQRFVPVGKN